MGLFEKWRELKPSTIIRMRDCLSLLNKPIPDNADREITFLPL